MLTEAEQKWLNDRQTGPCYRCKHRQDLQCAMAASVKKPLTWKCDKNEPTVYTLNEDYEDEIQFTALAFSCLVDICHGTPEEKVKLSRLRAEAILEQRRTHD